MLLKERLTLNKPFIESVAGSGSKSVWQIQWLTLGIFALCASFAGSPAVALLMGLIMAVITGLPGKVKWSHISKMLLQICVVLLGFSMDFRAMFRAGWDGAVFSAISIAATLFMGFWFGEWLKLNRRTSALISSGTAICGGSAIAAVSSVLVVAEEEIAVAIGTVFILNGIALYLFPAIGHVFGLTQHQFGIWSGVAIHDISSVVGASMSYGSESLQTATAVKLARTLWIVPVALAYQYGAAYCQSKRAGNTERRPIKMTVIPWFIGGFLIASISRTFIPAIAEWSPNISHLARAGFVLVLLLIGASLRPQALKLLGWKTCAQGATLWILISVGSLLAILYFHL